MNLLNLFHKHSKIIALVVIFVYSALFFSKNINLVTGDLGRHIKNGETIVKNHNFLVLSTNFYSFTQPGFQTINHHWGSGVVFYLIHSVSGFIGLSMFYALLSSLSTLLIFLTARKLTNSHVALLVTLLALPLFATRIEIRPEGISYFFITAYLYILLNFINSRQKTKSQKLIYILPFLQLLWVNLHIFFVFGLGLIGAVTIQAFIQNKKIQTKLLVKIMIASAFVTLLNPLAIRGAFVPLTIFKQYGYMLVENQSIFFIHQRFPNFRYVYFILSTFISIQATFILYSKKVIKQNLALILVFSTFTIMGIKSIRLIPLSALLFIPLISVAVHSLTKNMHKNLLLLISGAFILVSVFSTSPFLSPISQSTGMGLIKNVQASANFYKSQNIQGPIFNNYDIGGYLIYNFPKNSVFVDNRPEAYSVDFFQQTYIPMQEDEKTWHQNLEKYDFNAIYFYRRDATPWAQPFLIRRLQDPDWIPVYVDEQVIILLKNNKKNSEIIQNYGLPAEMFIVTKT